MSPASHDPEKRRRQLANLRRGGPPNAGSFREGEPGQRLVHGLRTTKPPPALLGEYAETIVTALEHAVPLRDATGAMLPAFAEAVQAAAVLRVQIHRCQSYLAQKGDRDARGRLRPEVEQLTRTTKTYLDALGQLGATPMSYARLGFDVARTAQQVDLAQVWAAEHEAERAIDAEDGGA